MRELYGSGEDGVGGDGGGGGGREGQGKRVAQRKARSGLSTVCIRQVLRTLMRNSEVHRVSVL